MSCDLNCLPDTALSLILRMLRSGFQDVRSLSYVNKYLRYRVLADISILYTPCLDLDKAIQGKMTSSLLSKQVLSLKVTNSTSMISHSHLEQMLPKLDLSNLKYLELRSRKKASKSEYLRTWKVLGTNSSLNCQGLEHMAVDICLINLSEIRDAIINVVYQPDDFENKDTNICYIINSAVSQVLYNFLTFFDDLIGHYDKCLVSLRSLELTFVSEVNCDWSDIDLDNLDRMEVSQLNNCLEFMLEEFKQRFMLKFGTTEVIKVFGIPNVFCSHLLDLVSEELESTTRLWPKTGNTESFNLSWEKHEHFFDAVIMFPLISEVL